MDTVNNSGSRIVFTANGQKISVRAHVSISPADDESAAIANSDGTMAVSHKPHLWEMEVKFSDNINLDLSALLGIAIDATVDCYDIGRVYMLTQARIVGKPKYNMEDGAIEGCKVACPRQRVNVLKYAA